MIVSLRKRCSKCKRKKAIKCFYKDSTKSDGFYSSCKDCGKKYAKVYIKNPINKQRKQEYDKSRRQQIRPHLKALYDITLEQYEQMLEQQNEVCAI